MSTVGADLASRVVADIRNRAQWGARRSRGLGASDAASWAKVESAPLYLRSKLWNPFDGNAYTRHGNDREAHMLDAYGFAQNHYLIRARENDRHLATPDGIRIVDEVLTLAQCKTVVEKPKLDEWKRPVRDEHGAVVYVPAFTNAKGVRSIPPSYRRQMSWEQYVTGAARTLFIYEPHREFTRAVEPESIWFERDDDEIARLVTIANLILAGMDAAEQFRKEHA